MVQPGSAAYDNSPYDLVAFGRVGVDLLPLQVGEPLDEARTFEKYLGGSAANVAVAASRHGRRVALISATGDDPFGRFIHRELLTHGVDDVFVATISGGPPTPVTFCEIFPPDRFPVWFYRYPTAPDLLIDAGSLPLQAIRDAKVYWSTLTGLSQEPSRAAHLAAWRARARRPHTVLDLDYRPGFWPDPDLARAAAAEALEQVTVAFGNAQECAVATGETDPRRAAHSLLDHGPELVVVKDPPRGVIAVTRSEEVFVPSFPMNVINGIGAGDGFGGALVHGLLSEWDLDRTLHFCVVAAAIVASRRECSRAMPTTAEVSALLEDVEVADGVG